MSKQDSQFINVFGLLIGILVAIAVLILAFANDLAAKTQVVDAYTDPRYVASVQTRVAPFGQEAVAGQDNSALKIQAPAGATASVALAVPANGKELFEAVCKTCHETGLAGAPKAGDKSAWGPRIAEGKAALYMHALNGYTGHTGIMPAKGGRTDLPDALIRQGVDYIVSLAQ